ncbi:hypothetical protein [Nitriliruptor alkaliphilus]|uniref:hypothetical protein n=1 Tax=Nitriliruptor alkaliphilus TaxID=427918 RepID=UPI001B801B59|nr:hypothetical protein [Nitriliruptor alkaliphilus]
MSAAADDPDACTRLAATVTPAAIAPRSVARTVGDVVARCIGAARHDEVVLAVHEVLCDALDRGPSQPLKVRVRERDDRVDIEIVDGRCPPSSVGPLHVARALADDLKEEVTDAGHVIRLSYWSA